MSSSTPVYETHMSRAKNRHRKQRRILAVVGVLVCSLAAAMLLQACLNPAVLSASGVNAVTKAAR